MSLDAISVEHFSESKMAAATILEINVNLQLLILMIYMAV